MYYHIELQTENHQIGKEYPQTDCLTQIHAHSLSSWEFPKFEPKIIFKLSKKAILTDFLSNSAIGARGYLVSQKAKEILIEFNLMDYQFYPVIIQTSKGELIYFWLHLTQPDLIHEIDYRKSIFYETKWEFREDVIQINSYDDYLEKKKLDTKASFGAELDKTVVKEQFNKELDLFTFLPFDNNIYISEKLKNSFLVNNITGIDIEEASNLYIS